MNQNILLLDTLKTQGTLENGKIQRASKMKFGIDPVNRRRDILSKKKHYRTLIIFVFLVAMVGFACQIPGSPGEGTPGILPTQESGEPTLPPVEPTEPPIEPEPTTPPEIEPTTPPEFEPTVPPDEGLPPADSGDGTSDTLIQLLFWLVVLVVVILGIALIVSLFTGRKKASAGQPAEAAPGKAPSYAETDQGEQSPQPAPELTASTALDHLSPQVGPLYDRLVNLLQGMGPVTILPTQSRVDFQRRIIFVSAKFSQEDMRVQLVLPRRVDDPRMVRIEVFSEDMIAHTLVLRSTDEFDARFTAWLQEAYRLGG
jgi:hypothetical protein